MFPVPLKAGFQIFIICLADYPIQVSFLLHPNHGKPYIRNSQIFQIAIDSPNPEIDGLRLIVFQEIKLV